MQFINKNNCTIQKILLLYPSLTTNSTGNQLYMQFNSTEEILVFLQNEIKHQEIETSRLRDETVKMKSLLKVEKEKHR